MEYKLTVKGYSDDTIEMQIMEGTEIVFEKEFGPDNEFKVNDKLVIHTYHTHLHGWIVGLSVNETDEKSDLKISMGIAENGYSPVMTVESNKPFVVEGIFGDMIANIKDDLGFLSDSEVEEVINVLIDGKYIKP